MNSENIPQKNENENLAQKVHYYLRFSGAFIIIHLALAGRTLRRKKEVTRSCRHGCVIAGSVLNGSTPVDYTNEIWL